MNPHIFRQYDIRGVADADLDDDVALALGRAFGTFQRRRGNHRLALGRDCRLSSPRLHRAILRGMLETGAEVVDVGVVPTPLMYFAVFHHDLDGGLMITGSHNPPPENGLKMMKGKGSLYGDDIQELRRMVEAEDFELPGGGRAETRDVLPAYVGFMKGNIRLARTDLRFAVDAGNGAGGPTALAAMRALGLSPVPLLCEMDGTFPVHHPDPTDPHSLELLRRRMLEDDLELGIAYDGDADRIGVVDRNGDIVWGDRLMIVFSRALLRDRPGAAVLGEVKCSQTLYDDIYRHGGRPILWKTGHSLIKTKMKEEGALLAGEMSGHLFFADRYYGFDDAVYASLRLVELLSRADAPLHELLADVPRTYSTPEIRVECADDRKFDVVDRVLAHYRTTHDVVDIDGARVNFDGGWGLVRASNTQPVLVLRFEATSEVRLAEIRRDVEAVVELARG
jgi:phosphomannomutase/phosphoglucomutase